MTADRDRDLARDFAAMRDAEARHTPPFARVVAGRRRAARGPGLRLALAVAAVALAAVALWRFREPNERAHVIAFTPGNMRVPTDWLLDMALAPRAGEIPRLAAPAWFPVPLTLPDTRRAQ